MSLREATNIVWALRINRISDAFSFARLISWDKHEAHVSSLFKYLTKPAQQGYRKVSLRQILRADKLAFAKMAEAGAEVRADASGTLPLDARISSVLQDYDLIVALLPLGDFEGGGKLRLGKGNRSHPYEHAPNKGKPGTRGSFFGALGASSHGPAGRVNPRQGEGWRRERLRGWQVGMAARGPALPGSVRMEQEGQQGLLRFQPRRVHGRQLSEG